MQQETPSPMELGRRERQIMTFLYRRGSGTVAEVREGIADPPSYSGVRAMLRILEEKGLVEHEQDGPRYIYRPVHSPDDARRSAVDYLLRAFFSGSAEQAVAALLDQQAAALSEAELDRLAALITQAKQKGA